MEMMDWIDLCERTPFDGEIVLVCDSLNQFVSLGRYIECEEFFELMHIESVEIDTIITHWMPLPQSARDE